MNSNHKYPHHTIGEHIVPFSLVFTQNQTVTAALNIIKKKVKSWPNAENIFVVDRSQKLIGEIEFTKLLSAKPDSVLGEIMNTSFNTLTDHSHQSTAIKLAISKGVETIPVTNHEGVFLGILDSEQILQIMHEEHVEKLMHFSGILNNEELLEGYKTKITHVVSSRLPWLLLGLFGGALATFLIRSFTQTLETQLALAFFIPVIVYTNAAVGAQAQTIFVRNSSFEKLHFVKSLVFELKTSLLLGLTLASVIYIFTALVVDHTLGVVVSISMFLGILASAVISTFVPYFLQKQGKDPAIGSGPFTTIIHDLVSILIYFSIASLIL